MLCSLVPLVKDSLGDIAASSNYRAIAIGSLLLKLFDWVILLLEGEKLDTDQLQYGFQAMASTTMCSFTLSAVVEHFMLRGRMVYGAAMDISKAFDMCSWRYLFQDLIEKDVSAVVLRVMLFIYRNQYCDVRWNNKHSYRFGVSNGVRQGSVVSPLLFSVYVDKLIKRLRSMAIGCTIAGVYYGVLVYADDVFLLSPTREGLQIMVDECVKFASDRNLTFSTHPLPAKSKTKTIVFSKCLADRENVAPILLDGVALSWVESPVPPSPR